jgi:hypothetical protein
LENGRLALRSAGARFDVEELRRILDGRASVSPHGIWLAKGTGWQQELVQVLKEMASVSGG